MNATVPDSPDSGLVDDFVAELRGAGVETADQAIRVLALHAYRRRLTRDQLVQVVGRFVQLRWDDRTREAADRLLQDIGSTAGVDAVIQLQVDVATASGDPPFHLQRVVIGQLVADLEAALKRYKTAIPVTHARVILQRYRERLAGRSPSVQWLRCAEPASHVIDAYSPAEGRLHGSLDAAHYACAAHVAATEAAIASAGMTADRSIAQVPRTGRRCGHVFDYTTYCTEGGESA